MAYPKGKCYACGKELDSDRYKCCNACRKSGSARKKALYEYRIKNRLCTVCGTELESSDWSKCKNCSTRNNDRGKKLYQERKAKGLCCRCGGEKETKISLCNACKEKERLRKSDNYRFAKENKFCPRCKKERLYLNESYCPECSAKNYEYNQREETRIRKRSAAKEQYYKYKENGICTVCGSRANDGETLFCPDCRKKRNARNIRCYEKRKAGTVRRSERRMYGLCYICGSKLDREGSLCTTCYQKNNIVAHKGKVGDADSNRWRKEIDAFYRSFG